MDYVLAGYGRFLFGVESAFVCYPQQNRRARFADRPRRSCSRRLSADGLKASVASAETSLQALDASRRFVAGGAGCRPISTGIGVEP